MNFNVLLTVFVSIFLAELGDKTQVATLCLACDKDMNKVAVFVASSSALVLACLLAVLIGSQISHWVSPRIIKTAAGLGFLAIGAWILFTARS
jgi:putative Ca2+/H+ antiporter (TMEM165/GDT1 family)